MEDYILALFPKDRMFAESEGHEKEIIDEIKNIGLQENRGGYTKCGHVLVKPSMKGYEVGLILYKGGSLDIIKKDSDDFRRLMEEDSFNLAEIIKYVKFEMSEMEQMFESYKKSKGIEKEQETQEAKQRKRSKLTEKL